MGGWQLRSDRFYVGVGFIIGGFVFLVAFTLSDLLTRHPDWVTTTGELVELPYKSCDDSECRCDVVMAFPLANGTIQKTLIEGESGNGIWDEIPAPPDEDDAKNFIGAKLKLHYDPTNPKRAALLLANKAGGWKYGVLFGGIFIPLGVGVLWGMARNRLRLRRLYRDGQRFQVVVDKIQKHKRIARRTGGGGPEFHPWVIQTTWLHPQTGKAYKLESGPLWADPGEFVRPGGRVDALVDFSGRPHIYAIDTLLLGETPTVRLLT